MTSKLKRTLVKLLSNFRSGDNISGEDFQNAFDVGVTPRDFEQANGESILNTIINQICYRERRPKIIEQYQSIVPVLIKSGAYVNGYSKNHNGETPLTTVCGVLYFSRKWEWLFKLLLDNGADVNKASKNGGRTPLQGATRQVKTTYVKRLIKEGAKIDQTDNSHPFYSSYSVGPIREYVKHGFVLNSEAIDHLTNHTWGLDKLAKEFFREGKIDLKQLNSNQEPIIFSMGSRNAWIKAAIESGADVNVTDKHGRNIAQRILNDTGWYVNMEEIFNILIKNTNIDLEHKDSQNKTITDTLKERILDGASRHYSTDQLTKILLAIEVRLKSKTGFILDKKPLAQEQDIVTEVALR